MPRNISFALTTAQFRDRTKTVTRRDGWEDVKVGEVLCGVVKSQGLKKGEKVEKLGLIRVVKVSREPLNKISYAECVREGFPAMYPSEFIAMFCASHRGCKPESVITRIEYEYILAP